ncbi:MAG: response regulator [Flavobacterium sp.]|uniref:ATP-binding protein n=1 Tax=unclassified Flavobacterium TaxID=196869 RepID=UPI000C19B067|nr:MULTISPECIES: ATP-binding protein [unclassified Flavobacterium]MDP3680578.1 response regulator [Flavobacterium sp.]PIF63430.1 signal transduction histidine kinase [Flavobacterium sp. 11]
MKRLINLNTYSKLLLLIISTSIFFFLIYISLYLYTVQEESHFYKITYNQYDKEVKSLFRLNSKTPTATIIDVTYWDELVHFTNTKDEKWYNKYILREFESYEADYIGIYGLDQKLINKTVSSKIKNFDFIPKEMMSVLYKSKLKRFYIKIPEGIVEVFGATIHPSNDPKKNKTKPSGYFFMARLLDESFMSALGNISSSKVNLVSSDYVIANEDDFVIVGLDLKDWKNEVVARLLFKRPFNLNYTNTKEILFIVVLVSLINIFVYVYYTKRWVYNPLKLIKSILETGNISSINSLKRSDGEFGYIGNLFEENSNQRKQLEISKQKAEESDTLKSSFLANLSHEIRTPMNAIMGFSDLLHDAKLEEEERLEYLKIIKNSGGNLVSIIEDLIEMSKIDARQIIPNYKGLDIEKCITELYDSIKVTIPKDKEIQFYILENPEKLQGDILTDETKLKQIIVNLITNALKFTDRGFVAFGYSINKEKEVLEFKIEDSGMGISESYLKVIFDRFRRIEGDGSVELSGLGLGLSITKAYVEMLGGEIKVKSTIGQGSVFSFSIPLKFDRTVKAIKPKKVKSFYRNYDNEIILVAEDDTINFLLLRKIIESKNHTVLRAKNGQEAVDICTENPNITLVFMDIKMPILDGYQAFEKIKVIKPELPVVAQTAYSSFEDREKMMQFGFTDCITKPLDKEKVFELLDAVFMGINK